jgi:sugar phosphate isomerase/epimerase
MNDDARAPRLELCWATLLGFTVSDQLRAAADSGLDAITVAPHQYVEMRERGTSMRGVRRLMETLGTRVTVIEPVVRCLPGTPRPEDVEPPLRQLLWDEDVCFAAAEELGAEAVNLAHTRGQGTPEHRLVDAIGRVCERARANGMRVTLEFFPDSGVPDLPAAQRIARAVALPNFGIMFDVLHFWRTGGRPSDVPGLDLSMVTGLQIGDRAESAAQAAYVPMSGRPLPGEGDLPLPELFSPLLRQCPGVPVGIEVFSEALRALGPMEAARRAVAATRAVLDAAARG